MTASPTIAALRSVLLLDNKPIGTCGNGSIQTTKLVAIDDVVVLGHRKNVLTAKVPLPGVEEYDRQSEVQKKDMGLSPIPKTMDNVLTFNLFSMENHVETVCNTSGNVVGAVDSAGYCKISVAKLHRDHHDGKRPRWEESNSVLNFKLPASMQGWHGMSLQAEKAVVCSHFGKLTCCFDMQTGSQISKFYHGLNPMGLCHLDDNVVAVAEWGGISFWDVRSGNGDRQNSIGRASRSPLYSICVDGNTIASIGEQSSVTCHDIRMKGRVILNWRAPLKHEGIFVSLKGTHCFVGGMDHEFVGHKFDGSKQENPTKSRNDLKTPQSLPTSSLLHQNHRIFRSEASWTGLAILPELASSHGGDIFVGLSASGVIYSGEYSLSKF